MQVLISFKSELPALSNTESAQMEPNGFGSICTLSKLRGDLQICLLVRPAVNSSRLLSFWCEQFFALFVLVKMFSLNSIPLSYIHIGWWRKGFWGPNWSIAGTTQGASAKTLRIYTQALVFSAADYCALVWCRTPVQARLMWLSTVPSVSGCLKPAPLSLLPVLMGIAPSGCHPRPETPSWTSDVTRKKKMEYTRGDAWPLWIVCWCSCQHHSRREVDDGQPRD